MAKKEENKRSYLQMPIPKATGTYKIAKVSWNGLNYRQETDTGMLSKEMNISTREAPYLTPSEKPSEYKNIKNDDITGTIGHRRNVIPLGLFGFDDFLIAVYWCQVQMAEGESTTDQVRLDYIDKDGHVFTGIIKTPATDADKSIQRSVVQFNVYDVPTDPVDGRYIKKLLIFPDKVSIPMQILEAGTSNTREDVIYHRSSNNTYFTVSGNNETLNGGTGYFLCENLDVVVKEYTNTVSPYLPPDTANHSYYYKNTYNTNVYRWYDDKSDSANSGWNQCVPPAFPGIKYAAVHLSRLFGVDDARVYASGFNDYSNWNLDTADESNESNAWMSPAQANTKADGDFTAICAFQNHIVCFKKDFMHEIYNNKNPFRIQDIYAEGTIDQRSVQDADGRLIFVSRDGVKVYTGGDPRHIGYNLGIDDISYAVAGTDGRNYYLYVVETGETGGRMFTYDTLIGEWSEQEAPGKILGFAKNKNGMFCLTDVDGNGNTATGGIVYKLDTNRFDHDWSFETDIITRQRNTNVDIKHIRKISMLADIDSGAWIKIYFLYDDKEFDMQSSHLVFDSAPQGETARTGRTPIRVKPRNTAHYGVKLHVEGHGFVRIYEMDLTLEPGGEIYV